MSECEPIHELVTKTKQKTFPSVMTTNSSRGAASILNGGQSGR